MSSKSATTEELFKFVQMMEAGNYGRVSIAKHLSRPFATIQEWMASYASGRIRRVSPDEIIFNERSYKRPNLEGDLTTEAPVKNGPAVEIRGVRKPPAKSLPTGPVGVVSQSSKKETVNAADLWENAERLSAFNRKKRAEESEAHVNLGDGPVAISMISDQHIEENGLTDLKAMREDAELIQKTPHLYALLGGDGVNNHIKHRSAMLSARSRPDNEWLMYDHYLRMLNSKLIGITSGNHDLWTLEFGGLDMVRRLAESNRVFYAPHQMYIDVRVGNQTYKIAMRHQYRYNSSINQLHAVHRWYDMGEIPFDIGVICHHHESCIGQFKRHGRQVWGARPGSYQLTSNYAEVYGYNRSTPTCPTFILSGDEHRITGFEDVKVAARMLTSLHKNKYIAKGKTKSKKIK